MKKILSLCLAITLTLTALTSCNPVSDDTQPTPGTRTTTPIIVEEIQTENTLFVAEPYELFPVKEGERIQLLSHVVTAERVFQLLSIRDEAKIKETLDKITPQMSVDQMNQIHDDAERLYVREEIYILNHAGELQSSVNRQAFFGDKQIPIQSMHTGDAGLYVVSKAFYDESQNRYGNLIQKMNLDGQIAEETIFLSASNVPNRTNPSYNSFFRDAEGNCYAGGEYYEGEKREQFIDVMDSEGTILFTITEGLDSPEYYGVPDRIFLSDGNTVYTVIHTEKGTEDLVPILLDEQRLGEGHSYEKDTFIFTPQVLNGRIFLSDKEGIRSIRLDTYAEEEILLWENTDIDMFRYSGTFIMLSGNRVLVCGNRISEDNEFIPEWYILTRTKADEIKKDKKTLVVGGVFYEESIKLKMAVQEFNKSNQEYKVEIKNFLQELEKIEREMNPKSPIEFQKRDHALNLQIMAEGGVDIFVGNNIDNNFDFKLMARNGIFTDMNVFMNQDETFHKEDYMDLMYTTTSSDGGLYYSFSDFYFESMVVKKGTLPEEKNGWSLSEIEEYISTFPSSVKPFYPLDPESLLSFIMRASFPDIINESTKPATFDTDYFLKVLSFCKRYSSKSIDGEIFYDEILNDEILFGIDRGGAHNLSFYYLTMERAKENLSHVGYPAKDTGHLICFPSIYYAIAEGENKEGAWEFIKTFLDTDMSLGFPVKKELYEEIFQQTINKADDKGMITYMGSSMSINAVLDLKEAMSKMTLVSVWDAQIQMIIAEEVGAYFADQKSAEAVAAIIQDRIQTLLNER